MKADKREILTLEIIKAQAKKIFCRKIIFNFVCSIVFVLLCFIVLRLNIGSFTDYKPMISTILFFFIIIFLSVVFIESIIKLIVCAYDLITFPNKLIVATDKLSDINTKHIYSFLQFEPRYRLRFEKYGDFILEEHMESSSLNINDTFFLVIVGKKIVKIYNHKFFVFEKN